MTATSIVWKSVTIQDSDFYWAVGLFEGEGCFGIYDNSPVAHIVTTDLDVMNRFDSLFPGRRRTVPRAHKVAWWKDAYEWRLGSVQAIDFMKLFRPYMGLRRGEKIDEVLTVWNIRQEVRLEEERLREIQCRRGHIFSETGATRRPDGYLRCDECGRLDAKAWYWRNKERANEKDRQRYRERKENDGANAIPDISTVEGNP